MEYEPVEVWGNTKSLICPTHGLSQHLQLTANAYDGVHYLCVHCRAEILRKYGDLADNQKPHFVFIPKEHIFVNPDFTANSETAHVDELCSCPGFDNDERDGGFVIRMLCVNHGCADLIGDSIVKRTIQAVEEGRVSPAQILEDLVHVLYEAYQSDFLGSEDKELLEMLKTMVKS